MDLTGPLTVLLIVFLSMDTAIFASYIKVLHQKQTERYESLKI